MLSKSEIARLRALARSRRDRHEAGRFLVEGPKLVAEVLASELAVHAVIVEADTELPEGLARRLTETGVPATATDRVGLERIASTTTAQACAAEVSIPVHSWLDVDAALPVLVGVDLNDPGNVGTLARSAEAAGFGALVALGDTADPWGPKTIRASAGALFRLPVVVERDVPAGLERLRTLGFRRLGTRMHDAQPCDEADLSGAVALVLGSEAHGLHASHAPQVDGWVSIPMIGVVESLNVAMAGTILTYELARQRRRGA